MKNSLSFCGEAGDDEAGDGAQGTSKMSVKLLVHVPISAASFQHPDVFKSELVCF